MLLTDSGILSDASVVELGYTWGVEDRAVGA